jgi:hypothetical protein
MYDLDWEQMQDQRKIRKWLWKESNQNKEVEFRVANVYEGFAMGCALAAWRGEVEAYKI